jgi:vacuolar-type H+-ATPase subunit H
LKISEKTYYRYLNELIAYNYIIPIQHKEFGRFGVCDYILNQNPDEEIGKAIQENRKNKKAPNSKNQDIREHMVKSAKTKENDTSPNGKKQDGRKQDPIINSVSINKSSTNSSIYQHQTETATPFDTIDTTEIKNIPETVAANISLDDLNDEYPDKNPEIMELYQIICDVLASHNDTIRVAKQQLPVLPVKQAFASLNKSHLIYVLDCLEKNKCNIKNNAKGYIITALYNSIRTIGYYKSSDQSAFNVNSDSDADSKSSYMDDLMFKAVRKGVKF